MNSLVLKIIACAAMLIDHIGYFIKDPTLYCIFRSAGRIAFPIFAYLIAFGYGKTRNKYLYMLRLFLFGLVSELPFRFCFYGKIGFGFDNVYFTLFFGLASIVFFDMLWNNKSLKYFSLFPLLIFCAAAEILSTDYGLYGVMLVFIFYLCGDDKVWAIMVCFVFAFKTTLIKLAYVLLSSKKITDIKIDKWSLVNYQALFAFIPITLFDSQKKIQFKSRGIKKAVQYSFYLFYPLHLLIIGLIVRLK